MVDGWGEVSKKLQSLADEVHQAAPAGLFDAAAGVAHRQGPSSPTQMEQLHCITKVHCGVHTLVCGHHDVCFSATAAVPQQRLRRRAEKGNEQCGPLSSSADLALNMQVLSV